MRTIWKYRVKVEAGGATVLMPSGATVVGALLAPDREREIDVYADVDPDAERRSRRLVVTGTGFVVPPAVRHVAVVKDGPFVWHVFDAGQVTR